MLDAITISGEKTLRSVIKITTMKTLGQRIAHYRKQAEMSQAALAKACGWASQSRIGNYEKDVREPSLDDIELIANALKIPKDWLLLDKPAIDNSNFNVESAPGDRGRVPLISWIQAGLWCEATEPYSFFNADDYLPCPVPHSDQTYALKVRGESMYNPHGPRSFREGDIIYVDPTKEAENGSLVVVKLLDGQEATFKQLIIEGRSRYLKALNPSWPEPFLPIAEDAVICGVVISKLEVF